jgi:hypothetical protein
MNSYFEIEKVKSIILKDAPATKFTIGVKGVTEFRKVHGASPSDENDYDFEVWADNKPYTRIAREYVAAVIFQGEL